MPLGRGIVEVFEAIPERIEVSGHGPTWRVTGGSFESALAFAQEAFGDTVVVAREDRSRWWPRVTLTVTQDPELAAEAPPVETFADAAAPDVTRSRHPDPDTEPDTQPDAADGGRLRRDRSGRPGGRHPTSRPPTSRRSTRSSPVRRPAGPPGGTSPSSGPAD